MTGKVKDMVIAQRAITFFNQHSPEWTHPYAYNGRGTLHTSGCGIFALCHGIQWLTGMVQDPCALADFSCTHGGRGDDGTDRPALLQVLENTRKAASFNFHYNGDGLRNDLDALHDLLLTKQGIALCNLRRGHIVVLVDARIRQDAIELLAIDSATESTSERVRDHVTEVVPGTEIISDVYNDAGLKVGETVSYAAYWVDGHTPMDFNLLHKK